MVGDPHDPKTEVGALVHPEHYDKVMCYVEIGKTEGRLRRRRRPARRASPTGNYVAPTVFADVPPDARIFQEEIFGPVVAITPFDTDEEALELANGVKYGLAAYVWTNDLKRAHTFAQDVEAGMVWLNSQQRARPAHPVRRRQGLRASATRAATARSTSTPTSRPCTSPSAPSTPHLRQPKPLTDRPALTSQTHSQGRADPP